MQRVPSTLEVVSVYTLLVMFFVWASFALQNLKLQRKVERIYALCEKIDKRFAKEEMNARKYWAERCAGFWGVFTANAEVEKIKNKKMARTSLVRARSLVLRVGTRGYLLDMCMIFGSVLGLCHMLFIYRGGVVYKTVLSFLN